MLFEKKSYQLQPVAGIHVDITNVNYLNYFLEWLIDDKRRETWIWYIGQGQGLAFKDLYVLSAALKKAFTMERSVLSVVYSYQIIYFNEQQSNILTFICTIGHFHRMHRFFSDFKLHCFYLVLRRDVGDVHVLNQF